MDVSLSPGGTQWITSFMYLDQGMIKNKIVFYNFGLGKMILSEWLEFSFRKI